MPPRILSTCAGALPALGDNLQLLPRYGVICWTFLAAALGFAYLETVEHNENVVIV